MSMLCYGNALLCGISLSLVSSLQMIQNCTVRLVTPTRKRGRIRQIFFLFYKFVYLFAAFTLTSLKYRSWYKILLHTFKIMSVQAPVYLNDLVQKRRPVRLPWNEFSSNEHYNLW